MNITYPILGIDVSKAKLDVCVREATKQRTSLIVANTPKGFASILTFLQKRGLEVQGCTACLEATNVYSAGIALYLFEHGATVVRANPAAVHDFMGSDLRRAKTDKADAILIAEFAWAKAEKLRPWKPLPASYEELRDLTRRLYEIRRAGAQTKNQIEKNAYLTSKATATLVTSLRGDLAHHKKQATAILKAIRACLQQDTAMQKRFDRLTSPKGVGEITAVTFMAEIPDITLFSHAKKLAVFAGMTPHFQHSGTRTPVSQPISKMGSTRLRQAFYMAALSAQRFNPPITQFAQRLHSKGKKPMLVNVAVARKLLQLLYGIDKHQIPFDPNYAKCGTNNGTI
jgi:transposase